MLVGAVIILPATKTAEPIKVRNIAIVNRLILNGKFITDGHHLSGNIAARVNPFASRNNKIMC